MPMKVKLKDIPGLILEGKRCICPTGMGKCHCGAMPYSQAISDCGEREVTLDEGLLKDCIYEGWIEEEDFRTEVAVKAILAKLPQLLRAVKE